MTIGTITHQPPRRALLVLELAAIFDEVSGGSVTLRAIRRPHLIDEAPEIAAADVAT